MKNIIEIKDLSKSYGNQKAVSNLSFVVKEGELFAFLGINGAGKSTTMNIICGALKKDSGYVVINGYDIDKDINTIKKDIGVVFQDFRLLPDKTVYENEFSKNTDNNFTHQ